MRQRLSGALALLAALVGAAAASAGPEDVLTLRQRIDPDNPPRVTPEPLTVNPVPMIVAGDPGGSPSDSPTARIDPNNISSPFRGVCSLILGNAGLCTGAPISRRHILSAAHCVDFNDNGTNDIGTNVQVIFNRSGDQDLVIGPSGVQSVDVHPNFTGFASPALNDDLVIITLVNPLPPEVPIYPVYLGPVSDGEIITAVGYGTTGDGVNGFINNSASTTTKRTGQNRADSFALDDEGGGAIEVFEFDFDGPTSSTNCDEFGIHLTLGNDVETTFGGGDSGGPSFVSVTEGVTADSLRVWGVNTFGGGCSNFIGTPFFGSTAGGVVTSGYFSWFINFVPPSPFGLQSPVNGSTELPPDPLLQWSRADFATSYTVKIGTTSGLSDPVIEQTGLTEPEFQVPEAVLLGDTQYFWSVEAINGNGTTDPSPLLFFSFTTKSTGDLTGDGKVNGADLGVLLQVWGTAGGGVGADLNGDGTVDGADLGLLLQLWTG